MADNPQTAAVESGNACRNRLLEETRSVPSDDASLQLAQGLKELCKLGFPNFEITQNVADKNVATGHDKTS
jgi:hypothetical protein